MRKLEPRNVKLNNVDEELFNAARLDKVSTEPHKKNNIFFSSSLASKHQSCPRAWNEWK